MNIQEILNSKIRIRYVIVVAAILFIFFSVFNLITTNFDSFLIDVIIICIAVKTLKSQMKVILYVKQKNYNVEQVNSELNSIICKTKEGHIFTENCLILFGEFIEICSYSDILLIYKKNVLAKQTGPRESYFLITSTGNKFEIVLWSLYAESNNKNIDFEKIIGEKNPNILVGRTTENRKILKEKYNIKI